MRGTKDEVLNEERRDVASMKSRSTRMAGVVGAMLRLWERRQQSSACGKTARREARIGGSHIESQLHLPLVQIS